MTKEELFNRFYDDLAKRYPIGLYEYLYKYRPDLDSEWLGLQEKVEKAILSGTVEELKAALREYWTFHMKAIREFKPADLNITQVRKEMNEERIQA